MGRPRGSRNRNTLARELMAAVNDQDSDFDPAIELCSQTSSQASALPCEDPKAKASTVASTQPLPTSSRKATKVAKPKALTQTKSTKKIGRVKKPLDAVELTRLKE